MSLILEALRKSEAERRLGSAPHVLAPMPVMHAPVPRRRHPVAIASVALSILALAFAGWWALGRSAAPVVVAAKQQAPQSAIASPTNLVTPTVAAVSSPAASPQVIPAQPPTMPAPATIAAPTRSTRDIGKSPASRALDVPHAISAPSSAKTRDGSALALASARRATASPPAFVAMPPAPVAAPPSPSVDEPALLSVSDLPASERSGLPAFKVTMHVYTDDPSRRFMIVDGQRVGEGARLGDGIALVHIRRDGAEIDVHGRRLLLSNP